MCIRRKEWLIVAWYETRDTWNAYCIRDTVPGDRRRTPVIILTRKATVAFGHNSLLWSDCRLDLYWLKLCYPDSGHTQILTLTGPTAASPASNSLRILNANKFYLRNLDSLLNPGQWRIQWFLFSLWKSFEICWIEELRAGFWRFHVTQQQAQQSESFQEPFFLPGCFIVFRNSVSAYFPPNKVLSLIRMSLDHAYLPWLLLFWKSLLRG